MEYFVLRCRSHLPALGCLQQGLTMAWTKGHATADEFAAMVASSGSTVDDVQGTYMALKGLQMDYLEEEVLLPIDTLVSAMVEEEGFQIYTNLDSEQPRMVVPVGRI